MDSSREALGTAVTDNEFKLFLGEKNQDYYLKAFGFLDQFGYETMHRWNWAAFLFGLVWIFYRKMYLPAVSYLLVIIAANVSLVFWPESALLLFVYFSLLMIWPLLGFYGNALYRSHVKNRIAKIKLMDDQSKIDAALARSGGVNVWAKWLGIGLIVVNTVFKLVY